MLEVLACQPQGNKILVTLKEMYSVQRYVFYATWPQVNIDWFRCHHQNLKLTFTVKAIPSIQIVFKVVWVTVIFRACIWVALIKSRVTMYAYLMLPILPKMLLQNSKHALLMKVCQQCPTRQHNCCAYFHKRGCGLFIYAYITNTVIYWLINSVKFLFFYFLVTI